MSSVLNKTKFLTTEIRASLKISVPLIASQLIQASSGFIGTWMIAQLGRDAMDAGILVSTIYITIVVFFAGILAAVSILVAQSYGAKNSAGVKAATNQGFVAALLLCIPIMLLLWLTPLILPLAKQSPHVISLAAKYLHAILWCIPMLGLLIVEEQFLIGIGKTRLVLIVSLLQVPFEILANYALVFGKFGFPKCGIAGLGYGFTLTFFIGAIFIAIVISIAKSSRRYEIFKNIKFLDFKYLKEIIRIGWPIGSMYTIEIALYTIVAFLMGLLGADALAAHQIAFQYLGITITIIFAISQATGVRVGQEVGRNNKIAAKIDYQIDLGIGCFFMLLALIVYLTLPKFLIGVDININDPKYKMVVHYAIIFLGIVGISQLFDGFRIIASGALRGLKDTKIPMYISIICYWFIGLPLAYLLAFKLKLGGAGLWWGITIGVVVGAIILCIRFNKFWQKIDFTKLLLTN